MAPPLKICTNIICTLHLRILFSCFREEEFCTTNELNLYKWHLTLKGTSYLPDNCFTFKKCYPKN